MALEIFQGNMAETQRMRPTVNGLARTGFKPFTLLDVLEESAVIRGVLALWGSNTAELEEFQGLGAHALEANLVSWNTAMISCQRGHWFFAFHLLNTMVPWPASGRVRNPTHQWQGL